jgi:hypothetical protein
MGETIRANIKRQVRRLAVLGLCGWLLIPLSAWMGDGTPHGPLLLVGFLLFFGAILFLQWVMCPKCSGKIGQNIGMAVAFSGFWFSAGRKPNYCPYCGVSLDTPCP